MYYINNKKDIKCNLYLFIFYFSYVSSYFLFIFLFIFFVFIFSLISFLFYFILFYFEGKLPPLQECHSCRGGIGIAELFRLSSFDPYPSGVLLVAFRAVAIVSGGSPRVTEQENVVHIVPVRPVFRPRILSGVNRSSVYAFRIGIRCSRRRFLKSSFQSRRNESCGLCRLARNRENEIHSSFIEALANWQSCDQV